jgi:hypothetical protein
MKKIWIFVAALAVVVLILSTTGMAYAQAETPEYRGRGFGLMSNRMMDMGNRLMGNHMGPGHRMGARGAGEGPMHESMTASLTGALGIPVEELETRREAGETVWQIAQSLGFGDVEIRELMGQAKAEALAEAVAGGQITQEQADRMLERQGGHGACDGSGQQGQGRSGHGRMGGFGPRFGAATR